MHQPRFDDSDFESRKAAPSSHESLGISERGMELLCSVNEILDNIAEKTPSQSESCLIVGFTDFTE